MYCFCRVNNKEPVPIYDQERGEYVCQNCGQILQHHTENRDKIIETQVQRPVGPEGKISGTFGSLSPYTKKLVAQIGLNRRQTLLIKHINPILEDIEATQSMRAEAYDICDKINKRGILKSKHTKVVCGGVILLVCHIYGRPASFKKILSLVGCKSHLLSRMYGKIREEFPIETKDIYERTKILLMQYYAKFGIKNYSGGLKILEVLHDSDFTQGKSPYVIASYVLYVTTDLTEEDIMSNDSITIVSLRKYVTTMKESGLLKGYEDLLLK